VAALLSLLVNEHEQKGMVILTSVELIHGSERRKKAKEAKMREEEVAASQETFK